MSKDYIKNIETAERRFLQMPVQVQKRMDEETQQEVATNTIGGYAAMFNKRTDLGYMFEEIAPGAFDGVMSDDVRCLYNHDPNYVLARSASGTLKLSVDEQGLKYEYETPNRTFAKDLQDAVATGDVSQSSFAFSVEESIWTELEDGQYLRTVTKVKRLYDVAPVTYPAYQDTTVAQRSLSAFIDENKTSENALDISEATYMHNLNKL